MLLVSTVSAAQPHRGLVQDHNPDQTSAVWEHTLIHQIQAPTGSGIVTVAAAAAMRYVRAPNVQGRGLPAISLLRISAVRVVGIQPPVPVIPHPEAAAPSGQPVELLNHGPEAQNVA